MSKKNIIGNLMRNTDNNDNVNSNTHDLGKKMFIPNIIVAIGVLIAISILGHFINFDKTIINKKETPAIKFSKREWKHLSTKEIKSLDVIEIDKLETTILKWQGGWDNLPKGEYVRVTVSVLYDDGEGETLKRISGLEPIVYIEKIKYESVDWKLYIECPYKLPQNGSVVIMANTEIIS